MLFVYTMGAVESIGVRQARAELPALIEQTGEGRGVLITRHGKPAAALLPAEAAEVWEQHLQAKSAREQARTRENELGRRLPTGRQPRCPTCRSSYMYLLLAGAVVYALVNVADPASGVQAILATPDRGALDKVEEVICGSCGAVMGERPRKHGYPAYAAAVEIEQEGPGPEAWEFGDITAVRTDESAPSAGRITLAHDLERGYVQLVTYWEWLTGVTDEEREQLRAQADPGAGLWP
jgi:prevent-host-death family protein